MHHEQLGDDESASIAQSPINYGALRKFKKND